MSAEGLSAWPHSSEDRERLLFRCAHSCTHPAWSALCFLWLLCVLWMCVQLWVSFSNIYLFHPLARGRECRPCRWLIPLIVWGGFSGASSVIVSEITWVSLASVFCTFCWSRVLKNSHKLVCTPEESVITDNLHGDWPAVQHLSIGAINYLVSNSLLWVSLSCLLWISASEIIANLWWIFKVWTGWLMYDFCFVLCVFKEERILQVHTLPFSMMSS